jgi:hypothetical protein
MAFERFQQTLAAVCVPDDDRTVVGTRGDLLPVSRIRYTADPVGVSGFIDFIESRIYIYHDQLTVIATGRNVIVDGRE